MEGIGSRDGPSRVSVSRSQFAQEPRGLDRIGGSVFLWQEKTRERRWIVGASHRGVVGTDLDRPRMYPSQPPAMQRARLGCGGNREGGKLLAGPRAAAPMGTGPHYEPLPQAPPDT